MAARVSQAGAVVVQKGTPAARASQSGALAIYVRGVQVSAQSGLGLSGAANESRTALASGLSSVNLSPAAFRGSTWIVSASSSINLGVVATSTRTCHVSASGSLGLVPLARRALNYAVSAASTFDLGSLASGRDATHRLSAATTIALSSVASEHPVLHLPVSAASGIRFRTPGTVSGRLQVYRASGSSQLRLGDDTGGTSPVRVLSVLASSAIDLAGSADRAVARLIAVAASDRIGLVATTSTAGARSISAVSSIGLAASASEVRSAAAPASSSVRFTVGATGGRVFRVSATTGMGLSSPAGSNRHIQANHVDHVNLSGHGSVTLGTHVAVATMTLRDRADALVQLPSGGGVPGGDSASGMRTALLGGVSGDFPMSYAETPSGLLLIADGIDPMFRWDGLTGTAEVAGVAPPATPIALGGAGVGTITGLRYAYCRFLDGRGNPSNLSPVSNAVNMGRDGAIDNITYDSTTGTVTIRSDDHGLFTGEAVVLAGIEGLPVLNGTRVVTVLDANTFTLQGIAVASGSWTRGGSWTWGVTQVVYQDVPAPAEPKAARRQILRNLDGSLDTLYVDIDTPDLSSAVFISTKSDEDLAAGEPVPLMTPDEIPFANRFGVPPSHKAVVLSHSGRIFATADVTYKTGCVLPRLGSPTIRGVGTAWPATFVGRWLYVDGATRAHEIAAVDVANQVLTIDPPYAGASQPFAFHAIRPAPAERKLVYYSEPANVEAWPPWNAFAVPDDSDEIVGLAVQDGFLLVVERRHIYRVAFDGEPAAGIKTLAANRGAINHRCVVQVEGRLLILDEVGIHEFDGRTADAISTPIQSLFEDDPLEGGHRIDWSADSTTWHGVHDPVRETVRWFVTFVGDDGPRHAICYHDRSHRWWIEEYPAPITAGAIGTVSHRRALVGTTARRVLALSEGILDLAEGDGSELRGTVTAATTTTLTDTAANFPASLADAPVTIVDGRGRDQTRIVASNTAIDLEIVRPWDVIPDTTSIYQVGGVSWSWRSGWFAIASDEAENPRDVQLVYRPTIGDATIEMRLFFDHDPDPRPWAIDSEQDGIVTVAGDTHIRVGTRSLPQRKGIAAQRLQGHSDVYSYGDQFVSVMLSGVQSAESIRVYQVNVNGASGSDS